MNPLTLLCLSVGFGLICSAAADESNRDVRPILSDNCYACHGPDAKQRYLDYAQDIHDSGTYLLSLINDILDIARVETGKVHLTRESCSVAAFVEEQARVVRRAYPDAAPIRVEIGADCPAGNTARRRDSVRGSSLR